MTSSRQMKESARPGVERHAQSESCAARAPAFGARGHIAALLRVVHM